MSFSSLAQELVNSSRHDEFLSYDPKGKTLYVSSETARDYAIRYVQAFDKSIRVVTGKYKRGSTNFYIYCICCIQEAPNDSCWERISYFLMKEENRNLVYMVLGFTPDEGTTQEDLRLALETAKNAYTTADLGWIYRTLFGKWFKEDMPNATLSKWKEHHNYV
jgi:hypothetical protein